MANKLKILLTNDDGIETKSTIHLAQLLRGQGHQADIVIPNDNMSGIGSAMYFREELKVDKVEEGFYTVTGTPSDCVNLIVAGAILENNYDLIISGINEGENAGFTVYDSGTVAAARRAKMYGYKSIAASYKNMRATDTEMRLANEYLVNLLNNNNFLLDQEDDEFININIPQIPENVDGETWLENSKIVETYVGKGLYIPIFSKIGIDKYVYDNSDALQKHTFVNGCDHDTIDKGMVSITKIKLY